MTGLNDVSAEPDRSPTHPLGERVRAMAQLVAGILHEFNSPLGALRASIDTARAGVARLVEAIERDPMGAKRLAEQIDEILVIARQSSDRIVGSVETLGHFARVDRAEVDEVDLAQVITTALRLSGALHRKYLRIECDFEPRLHARCRVRDIENVLYHLLRNACDALNGRIDAVIRIEARRVDGLFEIVVRDNGPGIELTRMPTLFEPSLTTKGRTVGLGMSLATCRAIAQEHGGSLVGENRPTGGAAFALRFASQ